MTNTEPYWYLAGPMSDYPSFNFPAFDKAAAHLRADGINVVSPAELDDPAERDKALRSSTGRHGSDYLDFLRRDANIVMDPLCVGVIVLEGWEKSTGARLETYLAQTFRKPIIEYATRTPVNRDEALA